MKEIEYKFLVDKAEWSKIEKPVPSKIVQGYLSNKKECTVRIRIKNEKGFLTIKGENKGIVRDEFEYEIPLSEAEKMLDLFVDKKIEKERYPILFEGKKWEVDVFHGKLSGLILAELEVSSKDEQFSRPQWVTEDVSTNPKYFNSVLIERERGEE